MSRNAKRIAFRFLGVNDERSAAIPTRKMGISPAILEREISDEWLLCFDCFILHLLHVFVKPKTPLLPWLESCGGILSSQGPPRSFRYLPRPTPNREADFFSLSGVVDPCPCIHITTAKRDRIQALRNELTQNGPDGKKLGYGRACLQVYDDIELKISLASFLYEKDGEFGFHFHYHRTSPVDSSSFWPRMLCSHVSLDALIDTFSQCRDLHIEDVICASCRGFQCCPKCHTTVFGFFKDTESTSGMIS